MADLRELSIRLEDETGYDSIPTIETHYRSEVFIDGRYKDTGALQCVVPDCKVKLKSAEAMWKHVHFNAKHGLSFGKTLAELVEPLDGSRDG